METKTNMNPRANTLNPARRFTVRLSLAAGATVATLLGSQALASLERPAPAKTATLDAGNTDNGSKGSAALVITTRVTAEPSVTPLPTGTDTANASALPPAAPQLVVIRNPSGLPSGGSQVAVPAKVQTGTSGAQPNTGAIVPPRPVVVPAQPVTVQQPAPAVGAPAQPGPAPAQAAAPRPAPPQPAPPTSSSRG
jgi:hypothetical protein